MITAIEKPTKQRVLEILQQAMMAAKDHRHTIQVQGHEIPCSDGWVPWWVFSTIDICGSARGDRRLRELHVDPEMTQKYEFEKMHVGKKYYYRIRERNGQLKMQFGDDR